MVDRLVRDQEAVGSNPVSPTLKTPSLGEGVFLYQYILRFVLKHSKGMSIERYSSRAVKPYDKIHCL